MRLKCQDFVNQNCQAFSFCQLITDVEIVLDERDLAVPSFILHNPGYL
jgi:hypothetical protein